jgi:hypothetical protein
MIIPKFDITKVMAKEVIKNKTKLIFTLTGAFLMNLMKFNLNILRKSKR